MNKDDLPDPPELLDGAWYTTEELAAFLGVFTAAYYWLTRRWSTES